MAAESRAVSAAVQPAGVATELTAWAHASL